MKNWLIVGAIAVGFYLFSRKKFYDNSTFNLKGIRVDGSNIVATVSIQNPTNANITINSIAGSLFANGSYIANVNSFVKTIVNSNAATDFQLTFLPSYAGIFQSIKEMFGNAINIRRKPIVFTFDGSVNVDGFNLPVKTDYQF